MRFYALAETDFPMTVGETELAMHFEFGVILRIPLPRTSPHLPKILREIKNLIKPTSSTSPRPTMVLDGKEVAKHKSSVPEIKLIVVPASLAG